MLLFEGRDAAGKGGTIKRFMEHLNQIPKSLLYNNLDCVKWIGETKILNRLEDSAPIWTRVWKKLRN